MSILNSSQITTSNDGEGNAGNIKLLADEDILLGSLGLINASSDTNRGGDISLTAGEDISLDSYASILTNSGGEIEIQANQLLMETFSQIGSPVSNTRDGGDIKLNVSDAIRINGGNIATFTPNTPDISQELGDTGKIIIETDELELTGAALFIGEPIPGGFLTGGDITSDVSGNANAGDIEITARQVRLSNGAQIRASTSGTGDTGNIRIKASDLVEVTGTILDTNDSSTIATTVNSEARGNGEDLLIKTNRLIISDGAQIQAGTFGEGKGGNLTINTSELIEVIGTDGDEQPSGLFTATLGFGSSDAGDLAINTGKLIVRDGGQISASTFSADEGRAGNLNITASESVEVIGESEDGEFSSSILAETGRILNLTNSQATADGGSLSIETPKLSVLNGSEISTQTLGEGKAGNLVIDTSESVQLTNGTLRTRTEGSGDAGDLSITTGRLNIQGDDAEATASTVEGSGKGGDLLVTASDSVQISEGGLGTVSLLGGDSGNINIQTKQLIVRDGAGISNSSIGFGQVGTLEIFAYDSVQVSGGSFDTVSDVNDPSEESFLASRITTESSSLPENPAGNLSIQTGKLIVSDGAEITTSTLGDNPGGTLDIKASEFVEIRGFATADNLSNLSAQTISNGDAGDVTIETPKLIVRDLAQISADTSGAGQAGTLTILADDSVQLTGEGGLLVQAIEGSTAGNLNLETEKLTIADGGFISVSSLEGQAGNINITIDSLFQNQGQITAETGISQGDVGANINLEISDTWRVENESIVSATAFGEADGGNININQGVSDAELVLLAFPPTGTNSSDIIANAEQGDGGRIDLTAAGVFGIEFREEQTPLNDFTVSSEFGTSGETTINRTFEDPSSGLIDLPASVGDATDQISQNLCQQGVGSEFIISGKGGLPPDVNQSLNSESARVGLIEPVPSKSQGAGKQRSEGEIQIDNPTTEAVPAMGWIFNDQGEVTLTAYSTSDNTIRGSRKQHRSICKSGISP